jgi:hypothetical protein
VGLFRRDRPIHEQLAEAGGVEVDFDRDSRLEARTPDTASPAEPEVAAADGSFQGRPPDWHDRLVGPDGIAGRARRWDIVTTAEAPGLTGDSVKFIAIPDGTLVTDEDEPDDSLAPLADAVEATVRPPYRAEAVRQNASRWSVAAVRITVVEATGLEGDEAELVTTAESSTLTIDGRPVYGSVPSFERVGEAHGSTYVVRAERIDGDLWQVEAMPL